MRRTGCSPTGGYIAYKGYTSMEEVMNGGQSSHMVMGGYDDDHSSRTEVETVRV